MAYTVPESAYLLSNAYETEHVIAEPTEERAREIAVLQQTQECFHAILTERQVPVIPHHAKSRVETVVSEAEERILNVSKQNSRSIEETEMTVETLLNLDKQDGHNEIPPTQLISLDQSQDNGNVSFEPENPEHLFDNIWSTKHNCNR